MIERISIHYKSLDIKDIRRICFQIEESRLDLNVCFETPPVNMQKPQDLIVHVSSGRLSKKNIMEFIDKVVEDM